MNLLWKKRCLCKSKWMKIVAGQTEWGKRQLFPIRDGTVSGAIKGRVLTGGADAQIIRQNAGSHSIRYL
ncbi:DUF3237 family protein [Pseudomonas sp. ISL-88]|uniref:DUF3237 family protein n=1 Tax=Bacteria TaxID=2 RepID=UPI001BE9DF40|nr:MULTISPECIES: DUF3237 family protein [Bacteria]MBT2713254.1 DUF3237 family protein [Pseudomonas sp. ISL-88]